MEQTKNNKLTNENTELMDIAAAIAELRQDYGTWAEITVIYHPYNQ